jgi:hypothetical protein
MLKFDWYLEEPIDFEHKNYILLHYLQEIDKSFSERKLSPYLLHTQNLVIDMKRFREIEESIRKNFKSELISFNLQTGLIRKKEDEFKPLKEILEVIDFSIPQLEAKIQFGFKLLTKYPQIIY